MYFMHVFLLNTECNHRNTCRHTSCISTEFTPKHKYIFFIYLMFLLWLSTLRPRVHMGSMPWCFESWNDLILSHETLSQLSWHDRRRHCLQWLYAQKSLQIYKMKQPSNFRFHENNVFCWKACSSYMFLKLCPCWESVSPTTSQRAST